jgi:hypothetical protein
MTREQRPSYLDLIETEPKYFIDYEGFKRGTEGGASSVPKKSIVEDINYIKKE